jgi:hypothetical protein
MSKNTIVAAKVLEKAQFKVTLKRYLNLHSFYSLINSCCLKIIHPFKGLLN